MKKVGFSPGKRVLILLICNLVILVMLGLATEFCLRRFLDPRYAPRPNFEAANASTVWANTADLHDTYYGSDFSQNIVTDGFGNRQDSLGAPGPEESLVVLVGDSYTFGWGVNGDESYPAYLDQRLADSRPGWRVVNLGVSGFGTLAYAQRLDDYLHTVDHRRVKAVLILHADNDPVDNVLYLLYKTGFMIRSFPQRSPRSQSRLINMLGQLCSSLDTLRAPRPLKTGKMIWQGVDWGNYERMNIARDTDLPLTKQSSQLTRLQEKLMRLGVERIHGACEGMNLPIHHLVLYLGAESKIYAPAMEAAFVNQNSHGNRIFYHGLMNPGGWDPNQPMHNDHSGGHFTPAYNRHCADIMLDLLGLEDAAERGPKGVQRP